MSNPFHVTGTVITREDDLCFLQLGQPLGTYYFSGT
jgi:hypothetical protein